MWLCREGAPIYSVTVWIFSYKGIVCIQILVGLLLGKQCKTVSAEQKEVQPPCSDGLACDEHVYALSPCEVGTDVKTR